MSEEIEYKSEVYRYKSESYRPCVACDADCAWLGYGNDLYPCWGQVEPIGDDDGEGRYSYACEGHEDFLTPAPYFRGYIPEGTKS
jgi:hypothetical protein